MALQPLNHTADYILYYIVGSVVDWLKHGAYDQHYLSLKPTHAILLCF